jgi:hypothetical protein
LRKLDQPTPMRCDQNGMPDRFHPYTATTGEAFITHG